MYLLYRLLGASTLIAPILCIAIMIPMQLIMGKKMSDNAKKTAVSLISLIFGQSRALLNVHIKFTRRLLITIFDKTIQTQ